jgi:hypothetical protein
MTPGLNTRRFEVFLSILSVALFFASATNSRAADFSTLTGKHIVGYQGWYGCPSDKVDPRWFHWFRPGESPGSTTLNVDLWPDLSEFAEDDLCPTDMTLGAGAPAYVFSSENAAIVNGHFRWMRDDDIDGAAVQRFLTELAGESSAARANLVLRRIRSAAEAAGRGFFVTYDVTGARGDQAVEMIERDWRRLVAVDLLTHSASYMRDRGEPVVAVWGLGFRDRAVDARQAAEIIRFFKEEAHVTLLGGVPAHWRTLNGDSKSEAEWRDVYRQFDILSPWTVGRFRNVAEADAFAHNVMAPDIEEAHSRGQGYIPVLFPGFSWRNLQAGRKPLDQIPRLCGGFYNEQVANAIRLSADGLYSAMFDELDEGTALMKIVRVPESLPAEAELLAADATSCSQASDFYLKLAARASEALHRMKR